jgi:hypothetical protein
MLGSTIELLGDLCLSALTLLMSLCIVGSIVAALRAVGPGNEASYLVRICRGGSAN